MSICAITTGDKDCKADIKWLRQYVVLKTTGKDTCFIEIIAETKEGILDYLDLYIPYKITNLEDRTFSFFDQRNQLFFDDYKFETTVQTNPKHGDVHLELIKPINTKLHVNIIETFLKSYDTSRGTKINIKFSKSILPENTIGCRMVFDWDCISHRLFENTYEVIFRYYTRHDAFVLNIERALDIQNFDIWVIFPSISTIDSLSHKAIPRLYREGEFHPNNYEVIFGERNQKIWDSPPIISREWINPDKKPDKPALNQTNMLHLNTRFKVHIPEYEEDSITEQSAKQKDEKEYARIWSNDIGLEGHPINENKYYEIINNKNTYVDKYLLFIDDLAEEVYFDKNEIKKMKQKKITRKYLMNLILKGRKIYTYEEMANDWSNPHPIIKAKERGFKKCIHQHRQKIKILIPDIDNHINSIPGKGYEFKDNISFCFISKNLKISLETSATI